MGINNIGLNGNHKGLKGINNIIGINNILVLSINPHSSPFIPISPCESPLLLMEEN